MASQTIKKLGKHAGLKLGTHSTVAPDKILSADVSISGYTTFERKAEEMKIFLSHNPIPEEFLKKK
jgi:hypothetical protein